MGLIVLIHSISRLSLLVVHSYLWQNMRSKSIAKPTTSGWWRQLGSRTVGAERAGGAAAPHSLADHFNPIQTRVADYAHHITTCPPIFWQITLILFKPGGADYAHHITTCASRFSKLPLSLRRTHLSCGANFCHSLHFPGPDILSILNLARNIVSFFLVFSEPTKELHILRRWEA